ncbi:hypothetical protein J4417_03355 [Candidatus Woesearchaeota archaeon]|nr:hypothetical protein [Candidatus Woesearchaeota archaeon]
MLSIFRYILGLTSSEYVLSPENKYEYAVLKYFPRPKESEEEELGIVIFDGSYLETKLRENFHRGEEHLQAEFSRVRDEIQILANHLNGKKEKKLKDMIHAFSREDHFRFSPARVDYSLGTKTEALERLFRQHVE